MKAEQLPRHRGAPAPPPSVPGGRLGISAAGAVVLLGALASGATLRLWNLGAQVLSGDEFHAIYAALARPVPQILFVYQAADNCIPLSVIDRLLIDWGIPLDEWTVRLPVLISGFALLLLAPLWAWRRLGGGAALALAWLVALSPGLVFYSRIARSYAPATLFGCAAVVACESWQRRGGLARAALYVAGAATAVWFHLGVAPLALSPLLVAALALPRAANRGRAAARLALVGAATAAALAALLVPARGTLLPLLRERHGKLDLSATEMAEVGAWLAGTGNRWLAAALAVVFAAGAVSLARRNGRLGGFVVGGAAAQAASILWFAPFGHQSPIILARYLVFALPLLLVPVAVALGSPWPPRWRGAQPWLAAAACGGLLAGGPFGDAQLARSSFAHDELFLRFTAPRPRLGPEGPVAVYRWLARAGAGAVIELPWDPIFVFDRIFGLYQTLHDRRVVVAAFRPDPRLGLRNMTADPPPALAAARGRWLIVHLAIVREELHVGGNPWAPTDDLRRAFRRRSVGAAARCRTLWGAPDYEDEWAQVWDLDRVRRSPALPAAGGNGTATARQEPFRAP
jgi:hypothetical protein